jgi:hypothetical protein
MAINLVQIDGPVSASVLDDLRALPAISSATLIRL